MTNPQFLAFQGWITTEDPTTKVTVAPSVSAESFNNECKIKGKLEDTNTAPTVFIFAGNATDSFKHHGPESSLYSHKAGGGQAKAAAQLGKAGIPTLSLPTSGIDVLKDGDPIPKVAQDAVADLWKAVGNGCNLALLTRKPNTKKSDGAPIPATYYFADKFADGTEPAFWGGIDETPNPHLSKFYFEQLELIRDYIAAPDKTKFLEAKKIKNDDPRIKALKLGEDVKNGSKSDPWFDKKVAGTPTPTESPAGKTTTASEIVAEGAGNCLFNSIFLALAGEIIKGTFDDVADPKKKAFQDKFLKVCASVEGTSGIKAIEPKPLTWQQLKDYLLKHNTKPLQENLQKEFASPLRLLAFDLLTKPPEKVDSFRKLALPRVQAAFRTKALLALCNQPEAADAVDNYNLGAHELFNEKFKEFAKKLVDAKKFTDVEIENYKQYQATNRADLKAAADAFVAKFDALVNTDITKWWNDKGHQDYLAQIAQPGVWASDLELGALAEHFNVGVNLRRKGVVSSIPIPGTPDTFITLVNDSNTHFNCWSDSAWLNNAQGNFNKNNNTATVDNDHISAKLNLKLDHQKKAINDLCDKYKNHPFKAWEREPESPIIKVKGQEITLTDDGVRCKKLKDLPKETQIEVIRAQVEIMAARFRAAGINPDNWNVNITLCEEDKKDPNILRMYEDLCKEYGFGVNGSKPPVKSGLTADSTTSKTSEQAPPAGSKKSKWEHPAYDPAAEERKVKAEEDAVTADRAALEESKKEAAINSEAARRVKAALDAEKAALGAPAADDIVKIDARKDDAIKAEKVKIQKEIEAKEAALKTRENKVKLDKLDLEEGKLKVDERKIEAKEAELRKREGELKSKYARDENAIKAKYASLSLSTTPGAATGALKDEQDEALNRLSVENATENHKLSKKQEEVAKLRAELAEKKKKIKDARDDLEPIVSASPTAVASSSTAASADSSAVPAKSEPIPGAAPSADASAASTTGAAASTAPSSPSPITK